MTELRAHGLTQGSLLARLATDRPDREAVVFPELGVRWTFADLDARATALAGGLMALGVGLGDRVAVWSENHPDWIALQFAIARAGAVLVTANTALTAPEIEYLLRQSRTSIVVTGRGARGEEYLDALEAVRPRLPELRHVVVMEGAPRKWMLCLDALAAQGARFPRGRLVAASQSITVHSPANIQYTSGTTGFPKGVVLSHENIVENAWAMARQLGLHDGDRVLLQVPLFHCFGCVISVLGAATHGLPLIGLRRFDPAAALAAVADEACTVIHGVPTMFLAMLSHPDRVSHDLGSLRTGIMAGSMCPEALMRRVISEMGAAGMIVAYGLTEASPAVTSSAPDDPVAVRCGTVGRAIPGVSVRVVDPDTGAPPPAGEPGELQARGSNVMQGYFEMPEATAEALTADGWLRTGDLATRDASGLVRIVGRIKEMVIRAGENVYPAEVEDALRTHPDVRDAAVFGLPHDEWGEEVAAAVIAEPGSRPTLDGVRAFLADRLAHFKQPTRLACVDAFPLTGSGKVQRFRLPEELGWA